MDPRNPDVLYAASHRRRRHVYTCWGPIAPHKSTDGGKTWKEINKGLPGVEIGRIGMDISDANPEIIYAIVEAAERKGGFYKPTTEETKKKWKVMVITKRNFCRS